MFSWIKAKHDIKEIVHHLMIIK